MSCALWLKHLGFLPIILEGNDQLGGQLLQINRINRWVLGATGKTSREIAKSYADHVNTEAIYVIYQTRILSISKCTDGFELTIEENGKQQLLQVRVLVIATGVRVLGNELFKDIPGFQSIYELGLISFFPLDHLDKLELLKNKTVAVIGGGNNAYYTALDAAKADAKVQLLIRSKAKARSHVQKEAESYIEQGIISIMLNSHVSAFRQHWDKIQISLNDKNGENHCIEVDRIFVRTGFAANSDFIDSFETFSGMIKEAGYIKTDALKRTSIPWVYAIGDVTNAKQQSVVYAIADGAIAAQDISERI
jgi:thioredoxin reductase (NADPH)